MPRDRAYVLLGESFSGPIALRVAAAEPRGLAGLVFSCSFVRNPFRLFGWAAGPAGWIAEHLVAANWRVPLVLGRREGGAFRQAMQSALATVPARLLAQRAAYVLGVADTALLQCIEVPILYLRARRDRVVPRGAGEWIRRHAPQCRIEEIDGPHLLLQTRPADCVGALDSWMRALAV